MFDGLIYPMLWLQKLPEALCFSVYTQSPLSDSHGLAGVDLTTFLVLPENS